MMKSHRQRFDSLSDAVERDLQPEDRHSTTIERNNTRRKLYSGLQILKLDIEESLLSGKTNELEAGHLYQAVDGISAKIRLKPIKRRWHWWEPLENMIRTLGVLCTFIIMGTFCSLPLLFLRQVDLLLRRDPFSFISVSFKRCISSIFLYQSGIKVSLEGANKSNFDPPCVLLCFSHSSNLDGFIVSGTCPIRQLAFGKKELFVVPFFSWISLAYGGVPIDRGNRGRAVKALQRSVETARGSKVCIAIAPEGTRSTTGHLQPFKKGMCGSYPVLEYLWF